MGKEEIRTFLTYLAVAKNVSPPTQNQALQALLFLYRDFLESPTGWIDNIQRPRKDGAPLKAIVSLQASHMPPQIATSVGASYFAMGVSPFGFA